MTCAQRGIQSCRFAPTNDPHSYFPTTVVEPGKYRLDVPDETAYPLDLVVVAPGFADVIARAKNRDSIVEVCLPEGGRIEGRVLTSSGELVPGCMLFLVGQAVRADEIGRFAFHDVAIGDYPVVTIDTGRLTRQVPLGATIDVPGATRVVDVVLPQESQFTVSVVRARGGAPVVGATVRLCPTSDQEHDCAGSVTDQRGSALIDGLKPGEYWCWAQGSTIEPAVLERVQVPPTEPVILRAIDRISHRVFGRVVDPSRKPIEGVLVSWATGSAGKPLSSMTDKLGRFNLDGVFARLWEDRIRSSNPQPLWISLYKRGWYTGATYTVDWDRELELVLAPTTTVTGTVEVDRDALPPFDVMIRTPDGGAYVHNARVIDDKRTRRFTWKSAPAVAGTLEVVLADGRRAALDYEPSGNLVDVGAIRFASGASVVLTSVPALGADESVWVSWWTPDLKAHGGAIALRERNGRWQSEDVVPAGRWRFVVNARGFALTDAGVHEVQGSGSIDLACVIRRLTDVTVVVEADEKVLPGATVRLSLLDVSSADEELRRTQFDAFGPPHKFSGAGISLEAVTDSLGRAWFTRVPDGRVQVVVTSTTGMRAERAAVVAGQPIFVPVRLER